MAADFPPDSLDFLKVPPQPVTAAAPAAAPAVDTLPQGEVDRLMRLSGVDGVWVEQDAGGRPVVVLHYTPGGLATHLPAKVNGWPTRVVGGEPIRAQPAR